ncbi:MAG: hypothetical protein AB1351_10970 [Thermoproteota archaeon]
MTGLRINRELFSQVNADSGSLTMLSTIVHRFSEPGEYEGVVTKGAGLMTRRFTVSVTGESSTAQVAARAQPPTQPGQVRIDLKDTMDDRFVLNAGGYAVFYISGGIGGYVVQVSRRGKDNSQIIAFDSRELKDADMLSVTVIRPGTYSVTNALNNARAELIVNYPEPGKIQRNPAPVKVECTANQIVPDRIRIDPGQGLVFTFKASSRIRIDLVRPEDRMSRLRMNRLRSREQAFGQRKSEKKVVRRYRLMPRGMRN